jgi:hypothetical protein
MLLLFGAGTCIFTIGEEAQNELLLMPILNACIFDRGDGHQRTNHQVSLISPFEGCPIGKSSERSVTNPSEARFVRLGKPFVRSGI